jgi:hypothetical protein
MFDLEAAVGCFWGIHCFLIIIVEKNTPDIIEWHM